MCWGIYVINIDVARSTLMIDFELKENALVFSEIDTHRKGKGYHVKINPKHPFKTIVFNLNFYYCRGDASVGLKPLPTDKEPGGENDKERAKRIEAAFARSNWKLTWQDKAYIFTQCIWRKSDKDRQQTGNVKKHREAITRIIKAYREFEVKHGRAPGVNELSNFARCDKRTAYQAIHSMPTPAKALSHKPSGGNSSPLTKVIYVDQESNIERSSKTNLETQLSLLKGKLDKRLSGGGIDNNLEPWQRDILVRARVEYGRPLLEWEDIELFPDGSWTVKLYTKYEKVNAEIRRLERELAKLKKQTEGKCKYCGHTVEWNQNERKRWTPLEPGTLVNHLEICEGLKVQQG